MYSDMAAEFAKAYIANIESANGVMDEVLINRIAAVLMKSEK
jgi:DNA-binding MurR/RpiR family transcriptional regulator